MVVIPLGKGRIGRTMGSFSWMGSMGKLFTETAESDKTMATQLCGCACSLSPWIPA